MSLKTSARSALVTLALSSLPSSSAHAEEHQHESCSSALETELLPQARDAAKKLSVAWRNKLPRSRSSVKLQILGINDFHGRLGTGLKVVNRPVGGAAVLASYLRSEQASFDGTTLIVHAGDQVGASPPESALLQDEPAIQFLNLLANDRCSYAYRAHPLCNVVGTLGNHEFDEGFDEMRRLIAGGESPKGPFLEVPYRGARFAYVSANVLDAARGEPLLPAYVIKRVQGERIGIIGALLKETPSMVTPAGVANVTFEDEATAINRAVGQLVRRGIQTIVVTIHQGGRQEGYTGPTSLASAVPTGRILEIIAELDSAVDVVISGHTHQFTNALVNNQAGHPILVTQAFSSGTAFGDVELTIDRRTHDVVEKSARVVTTFADEGPGLTPATDASALVEAAQARVAPFVQRVVGQAGMALKRERSPTGESSLGKLIADAQRAAMNTQVALMNPDGIRADLDAGDITWGELFTIQPFNNDLVRMNLTGAQLVRVLEQQWSVSADPRFLQVSGMSYHWDGDRPLGSRVSLVRVGGVAIDPNAVYSVTANSFLAGGGDGFTALAQGQNRVVGPVDLNGLVQFVENARGPIQAPVEVERQIKRP